MKSTPTPTTAPVSTMKNETDCERVNTVLDQIIEGQVPTAEDEDYLLGHADDCSPCFDDIKKQRFFVGFLEQRLTRKPCPGHLPQAIMTRLQAEMA